MEDLRVPTTPLPVELRCTGGLRFVGDIFMPARSHHSEGSMRPDEWVNSVPMFFPFRPREPNCRTIFNRSSIVAVTVPADSNVDETAVAVGAPDIRVAVDADGQHFEGRVVIDMPPAQQRVVDWLNGPGAFITLRAGTRHHLIQKAHITRVVEMRED